jgi:hypothetical protein
MHRIIILQQINRGWMLSSSDAFEVVSPKLFVGDGFRGALMMEKQRINTHVDVEWKL